MPFRKLFCVTLTIAALFSASQLILITRLNTKLGIPDFLFAVGDEVIVDTAGFIVQMPTLVMCASLCPKGVGTYNTKTKKVVDLSVLDNNLHLY